MKTFKSAKGLFIIGTDTNVGKTVITGGLASVMHSLDYDVGVMKPISTGGKRPLDALFLKKASGCQDPMGLINPIHLEPALAPWPASQIARQPIRLEKVWKAYRRLREEHEVLLIEGIGGLLVPIKRDYMLLDLAKEFNLPALIVARAGLGTLNHTGLTLRVAQEGGLRILGVVLNGFRNSRKRDLAENTNPRVLNEIYKVRILGQVPYDPSIQVENGRLGNLQHIVSKYVMIQELLHLVGMPQKP